MLSPLVLLYGIISIIVITQLRHLAFRDFIHLLNSSSLYLVHIRALVSLYPINTDKYIHIQLNQHSER